VTKIKNLSGLDTENLALTEFKNNNLIKSSVTKKNHGPHRTTVYTNFPKKKLWKIHLIFGNLSLHRNLSEKK
jgi:hypothetical protein